MTWKFWKWGRGSSPPPRTPAAASAPADEDTTIKTGDPAPKDDKEAVSFNVPLQAMTRVTGLVITWGVLLILCIFFSLIFGLTGFLVSYTSGTLNALPFVGIAIGVLIGMAFYVKRGFRVVPQQQFIVVKRLGQLYRIESGRWVILCLPGLIDKIAEENTLEIQELELYMPRQNKKGEWEKPEIEFKDASAPVFASIFFAIGDSEIKDRDDDAKTLRFWGLKSFKAIRDKEPKERKWWERTYLDIIAWTLAYDNPYSRIYKTADSEIRPCIQKFTVDEACENLDTLARAVMAKGTIQKTLARAGATFDEEFLQIRDTDLGPEIRELRRLVLQGEKEGARTMARADAWAQSVVDMSKKLRIPGGRTAALRLFESQRGQETLRAMAEKEGVDFRFVARDMGGVLSTMNVENLAEEGTST